MPIHPATIFVAFGAVGSVGRGSGLALQETDSERHLQGVVTLQPTSHERSRSPIPSRSQHCFDELYLTSVASPRLTSVQFRDVSFFAESYVLWLHLSRLTRGENA